MHRYVCPFLLAAACGTTPAHAQAPAMPVGFGPQPALPAPDRQFIPTVNVAPVQRWTAAQRPVVAPGLAIQAYARDLDHPRWLYVLPNGDVLVAETNAPPKPDDNKGIKGAIMQMQMKKAGAATPSAN
ncbi:MAG: sorbosone dehydrogenase family protein, partial [Janthinobacterium sp.]